MRWDMRLIGDCFYSYRRLLFDCLFLFWRRPLSEARFLKKKFGGQIPCWCGQLPKSFQLLYHIFIVPHKCFDSSWIRFSKMRWFPFESSSFVIRWVWWLSFVLRRHFDQFFCETTQFAILYVRRRPGRWDAAFPVVRRCPGRYHTQHAINV